MIEKWCSISQKKYSGIKQWIWRQDYLSFLFVVVLCITPLIINPTADDYYYHPKMIFFCIVISVMGCLFVLTKKYEKNNKYYIEENKSTLYLFGFIIITFISSITSVNVQSAFWGAILREEGFFTILMYVALTYMVCRTYKFKPNHFKFFLLSTTIVAAYGILQYFNLDPLANYDIRFYWGNAVYSTMGNQNFLGSYLVLAIPIALSGFFFKRSNISLAVSGILFYCLLLTTTRSAWIGMAVAVAVFGFYSYQKKICRKRFFVSLIFFIAIAIVSNVNTHSLISNRFFTIAHDLKSILVQDEKAYTAGSNRIFIWKGVLALISQRPLLGYGPDCLVDVFVPVYKDQMIEKFGAVYLVDKAHNEYLQIWFSSGIFALAFYLLLVISSLKQGYRYIEEKSIYYIPIFASVLSYLAQAFFNISVVSVAYVFWGFLGILLSKNVFND